MAKPRVIFMGTPEFSVPSLKALANRDDIELSLVVTQPDRPAGRGKKLAPPAVKIAADELGLPLLQTDSLRHAEVKERIIAEKPDLAVVAAFGMILGKWILELPTHGCVNLHASLLPNYRGAAPITAAILAGDELAGVTLMQMDRGLDTGDMLATIEIPVDSDDTTESLTPKLAGAAAELLDSRLTALLAGTLKPVPQPDDATETRQLRKEDGRIDWNESAEHIERHVRAMWDWPRAWAVLPNGDRVQIHAARMVTNLDTRPGVLTIDGKRTFVGTGAGSLELIRVQVPGGKPVEGHALIQKLNQFSGQAFELGDA